MAWHAGGTVVHTTLNKIEIIFFGIVFISGIIISQQIYLTVYRSTLIIQNHLNLLAK